MVSSLGDGFISITIVILYLVFSWFQTKAFVLPQQVQNNK